MKLELFGFLFFTLLGVPEYGFTRRNTNEMKLFGFLFLTLLGEPEHGFTR